MRVPVRVHRGRGAVDAELFVRVRREVADRVDGDLELERDDLLLVKPCARKSVPISGTCQRANGH
jgi:hypothetical protein